MQVTSSDQDSSYLSIVENSPDFIMRYDRDFRHLYMNKAGLRVAGAIFYFSIPSDKSLITCHYLLIRELEI